MTLFYYVIDFKASQVIPLMLACFVSLLLTPYCKVEESFQTQALHDIMFIAYRLVYKYVYSFLCTGNIQNEDDSFIRELNITRFHEKSFYESLSKPPGDHYRLWDHEEFPGVVPRTFIGPFLLSLTTWPYMFFESRKFATQFLSRLHLAFFVITAFTKFAEAVAMRYGKYTRNMLILLTITQFHFLFYASRMLPNTFAMILVLYGYSFWLERRFDDLILTAAFTVCVFRADTLLLFGVIFAYELFITRDLSIIHLLIVGIPCGLFSILVTVLFDSFMWGRLIWPEGEGLYFNLYLNKSHEWGVQPFYWYFTSVLPRTLLFSFPFIFFASKRIFLNLGSVAFAFLTLYSFLPHKELRFVLYVVPLLNSLAANAISVVFMRFEFFSPEHLPESWLWNLFRYWFVDGKYNKDSYDMRIEERDRIHQHLAQLEEDERERKSDHSQYEPLGASTYNPYGADSILNSANINEGGVRNRKMFHTEDNKKKHLLQNNFYDVTKQFTKYGEKDMTCKPSTKERSWFMQRVSVKLLLVFFVICVHLCLNTAASIYFLYVSSNNYPGGEAMRWLSEIIRTDMHAQSLIPKDVAVHLDNLIAQTGYSRFLEVPGVTYDKSPNFLSESTIFKAQANAQSLNVNFEPFKVTYLLLERMEDNFIQTHCTNLKSKTLDDFLPFEHIKCDFKEKLRNCRLLRIINGFVGIHKKLDAKFLSLVKEPQIYAFRCTQNENT